MIVNEVKEKIKHALSYLKEYEGGYNFQEDDCVNTATNELNNVLKIIDNLWHPASEKPVMSERGMIIVELNDITACKYSLWRSTTTYECLCNNKGYIRRWLYLEDLLPKEGGEK